MDYQGEFYGINKNQSGVESIAIHSEDALQSTRSNEAVQIAIGVIGQINLAIPSHANEKQCGKSHG